MITGGSVSTVLSSLAIAIVSFGYMCYSAAMLPFLTDQIIGATSNELSVVVRWYYWVQTIGTGLVNLGSYFCNLENVYVGSTINFANCSSVLDSSKSGEGTASLRVAHAS